MTKTTTLVYISLLTALQCVASQIAIPLPISPVPINFALVSVYLCGLLLPPKKSFMCQTIYIFLGIIGIPVFAFFSSGLGTVLGATGGFILSYPFVSIVISFLSSRLTLKYKYLISLLIGLIICYSFGTAWFCFINNISFFKGITMCVLPFILGDLFKIAVTLLLIRSPIFKNDYHKRA